MAPIKLLPEIEKWVEANPYGEAGDTAVAMFEAWAECINNILDMLHEKGAARHENTTEYCAAVRQEAIEWGLMLNDAGKVITGIER